MGQRTRWFSHANVLETNLTGSGRTNAENERCSNKAITRPTKPRHQDDADVARVRHVYWATTERSSRGPTRPCIGEHCPRSPAGVWRQRRAREPTAACSCGNCCREESCRTAEPVAWHRSTVPCRSWAPGVPSGSTTFAQCPLIELPISR